MTSFCIKTNNQSDIINLKNYISQMDLNDVTFVIKKFSKYTNIIIHYLGNNSTIFYEYLASTLCSFIIDNYEQNLIDELLITNFFYFGKSELEEIKNICNLMITPYSSNHNSKIDITLNNQSSEIQNRKNFLYNNILDYLTCTKSMILSGFIKFRIYNYISILNNIIDFAVNEFVINKEYSEFINLLKLYITSKIPKTSLIHLVYISEESILLNENKQIISFSHNNLDIPYLSDISFSSNDYALNSLLSLLPEKLIIHTIDVEDDFIKTLQLIFDDKVIICKNCNICKTYQLLKGKKSSHQKSLHI